MVVMGIVNTTPDSFADGGRFPDTDSAADHALRLADEGAEIIDIGGESTRPGSDPVSAEEELRRVVPVIERLAKRGDVVQRLSDANHREDVRSRVGGSGGVRVAEWKALVVRPIPLQFKRCAEAEVAYMQRPPDLVRVNPH